MTGIGNGGDVVLLGGNKAGTGIGGLIKLKNGSSVQFATLNTSLLASSDKTFQFPNLSGTFGLLEANQTWSGDNAFSKGTSATTTVMFGEPGDLSSKACFNTKNTDGNDISFYFVGTTMVVEDNVCQ